MRGETHPRLQLEWAGRVISAEDIVDVDIEPYPFEA
jgi:hypothetical protein